MAHPQVSTTRAGSGTTLNARARKKSRGAETSLDVSPYVGHVRSLAEARMARREWKPEKGSRSKQSMEKEICSIFNLDLTTFSRLVTMAGQVDGPCAVRSFLMKKLANPNYSLQEYIDGRSSSALKRI